VAPTAVVTSSTGNFLTFTYTATPGGLVNGEVTVVVPAGWTPPAGAFSAGGVSGGTCGTAAVVGTTIQITGITLGPAGYRLDWNDERLDQVLPPGTAYEIAMVIREAVTNVVRHSRGDRVKVRLTLRRDRVRVTIRDNGVGFSAGQLVLTRDRRGLGLLGSAERLHGLGGLFEVTALRTGGTLVTAEAPVAATTLEMPGVSQSAS